MRYLFALVLVALAVPASAQEITARRVVIHGDVISAQAHAESLASSGGFAHCGRRGGVYEGLGFSTRSPDDAIRRSCFWGQRKVREIGTAWCPQRRGWVAVVRYY